MTTNQFGLGCMSFSGTYGETTDAQSQAVIHAAIERGVTFLDTGDFYGNGHNEMLIGKAIAGRRERVQLSVKYGALRGPDGAFLGVDNSPNHTKASLAFTLKRLGTDYIDVYRPARLDSKVPIEDTIGAIADLVKQGYVRQIGLSEVGVDTIRRAQAVHPIADLQIEYSPVSRSAEDKIFPLLHQLGISATLYGVMSRGLLTGSKLGAKDNRRHMPRFSTANFEANATVGQRFGALAASWGMTPGQLAIAYVRTKEPTFRPLIGARTLEQLTDSLGALAASLSADQVTTLEREVNAGSVAGERYAPAQMANLDSEK